MIKLVGGAPQFIREEHQPVHPGIVTDAHRGSDGVAAPVARKADPLRAFLHSLPKVSTPQEIIATLPSVEAGYALEHMNRATQLATAFGQDKLKLSADELKVLGEAGGTYDVGKAVLEAETPGLLAEPGRKLSNEEFDRVKLHVNAEKLAPVLDKLGISQDARDVALYHHERFDGGPKGYPGAVKGYDIPKLARLVAIVDGYDAMTNKKCNIHDRPFAQAMPPEKALSIIESEAGKQYDPDMAKAFVAWMRAKMAAAVAVTAPTVLPSEPVPELPVRTETAPASTPAAMLMQLPGLEKGYTQLHMTRASDLGARFLQANLGTMDAQLASLGKAGERPDLMALSPADLAVLRDAGKSYDVGKAAVEAKHPGTLADPTRKLSNEEFGWVKEHVNPDMVNPLLDALGITGSARDIALYHHARWDGGERGYPLNVQGTSIPVLARLMNIMDSYDAMTSKKCNIHGGPFAYEMPPGDALSKIESDAGKQFDPELARLFVTWMRDQLPPALPPANQEAIITK